MKDKNDACSCICFVTHVLNEGVRTAYLKLVKEIDSKYPVFMILNANKKDIYLEKNLLALTDAEIFIPDYTQKSKSPISINPGNLDLIFLAFYRSNRNFYYIWFIEYDVHYVGNWSIFFERFESSDSDLIGTTIEYLSKTPGKVDVLQRPPLMHGSSISWLSSQMVKGFFPICRVSANLLSLLDVAYRSGACGHYEIVLPTVAMSGQLSIEDIGGKGPFVKKENVNMFYFANPQTYSHSPGTFVFKPVFNSVLNKNNTLWHPVKPPNTIFWSQNEHITIRLIVIRSIKSLIFWVYIRVWFFLFWRPLK